MTKKELSRALSDKCEITKQFSYELVNSLFDVMFETLAMGEDINILGFGTFKLETKPEREAHNPKTMEKVIVPEHKVLKFKPYSDLKEAVR